MGARRAVLTGLVLALLGVGLVDAAGAVNWAPTAALPNTWVDGAATSDGAHVWIQGGIFGAYEDNVGDWGGINGNVATAVATVNADGSLAPWRMTTPNPKYETLNQLFVHGGWIYSAGGIDQTHTDWELYLAPLAADGSVGAWSERDMPFPFSQHTTAVVGNYAYFIDGYAIPGFEVGGGRCNNGVWRATFEPDGSLDAWTLIGHTPEGRCEVTSAVVGNTIFISGGWLGDGSANDLYDYVLAATANPDGSLGAWRSQLPYPGSLIGKVALAAAGGQLVIAGGQNSATPIPETYAADVVNGSISAWSQIGTIPGGYTNYVVTAAGSTVYFLGGAASDGSGFTDRVLRTTAAQADQTISFGPLPDAIIGSPDITLAGTASSGLPVSYSASGACSVAGSVLHLVSVGTCTVTASQAGNDAWAAAPDVMASFAIRFAPVGVYAGQPTRTALQPVNSDGSSVFRQGSAVPVKFRVTDANGVSLSSPAIFAPPQAPVLVAKSNGAGGVDETVYSVNADTTFRWDATNQEWIFNQSTKNLVAGVTYTYAISLADGTSITYTFGLR